MRPRWADQEDSSNESELRHAVTKKGNNNNDAIAYDTGQIDNGIDKDGQEQYEGTRAAAARCGRHAAAAAGGGGAGARSPEACTVGATAVGADAEGEGDVA